MRHFLIHRLSAVGFAAALTAAATIPALADDFGQRFTLDVAPNFQMSTTGDSNAPPPAGDVGVGYTKDHPVPNTLQLDYGLDYKIDNRTHLYYTHSNLQFAIGRILTAVPHGSLVLGLISDRTDTAGINHDFGHGLLGRVYYFNQSRMDVAGLCLNQNNCATGPGAANVPNAGTIDFHGYGVGASYNFGPKTRIGPLFTAGIDAKYVPRSNIPPEPCATAGEEAPNCLGLGHYTGSQWVLPYSLTMKVPIIPSHTLIPFVGYERASVLWRNEATPEAFNVTDFGIVKVISKNFALSITNLNFAECRCSDTVPPPDNVRFAQLLLKLDIKTGL
jgi:hypothetical protein